MKVVLGITMRNEIEYGPHAEWQIKDALEMEYDDIVVLDDGSTDGTYEILKEYESKYTHLHVFKNEKNSVKDTNGKNRWMTLVDHVAKFEPTWINVRAADQLYSEYYRCNMRKVLEYFLKVDVHIIKFPCAHLWRSNSWYRADNVWGNDAAQHNKLQVWRFSPKYKYLPRQFDAILHNGRHMPAQLGFSGAIKNAPVNSYFKDKIDGMEHYPIIVLHYGHTTHEKKEAKFRLSMEVAGTANARGMPGPERMPTPEQWLVWNGYKGFHEFDIDLRPVPSEWFSEKFKHSPKPEIKSFYNVIAEYNVKVAQRYQQLFDELINKIKPKQVYEGELS